MALHDFRVVVVGGGPVGLIAAHILSQAGIDFVVLEKHHTVSPDLGNVTGLWPQTMRVLDQLGLLEPLESLHTPLGPKAILTHKGDIYSRNNSFYTKDNHGYDLACFHRHDLLKGLYDNLSEDDKARILVSKDVIAIETPNKDSVRVTCADGTIVEGDIVIGADGVYSTTRQQARQLARASGSRSTNEEHPYLTTYRALYGNSPVPAGLTPGDAYESHGKDASIQFFIGHSRAWFLLYTRLPSGPTRDRARYTQQDADDHAAAFGGLHVTDKLLFRDLYAAKFASGFTNLEEGVVPHWSWGGRIVLAGDAAHKITPNIGWGFNSSVHDLVVLVNRLRALLLRQQGSGKAAVSSSALQAVFKAYQAERMRDMRRTNTVSAKYMRLMSWGTGWKRFLDRYVFPRVGGDQFLATYTLGAQIRKTSVLDWLDEPRFAKGRIPWGCPPLHGSKDGAGSWPLIHAGMPAILALL